MIAFGVLLLLISYLVPIVVPNAEPPVPALLHAAWNIGLIAIVIGVILMLVGHFSSARLGGRRYWY